MARERAAITATFALAGILFASLFARLPAIRSDLDLSEGELGLALLGLMVGSLLAQPAGGALAARRGSKPVVLAGGLGWAVALSCVGFADSLAALTATLFAVGVANGVLDVSMNVQGVSVERAGGRPILGTLHAAFSFGALGGAVAAGAIAGAGVGVQEHLAVTAGAGAVVALIVSRRLLPARADATPSGPLFARPTRALAALGALAFCALLAEGAVNDWSAVYLAGELDAGETRAAIGLAAFSLTMGAGRLAADRLAGLVGPAALARRGALLALAGLAAAVAARGPAAGIAGFAVMGVGLAALFPLALRAAAARGGAAGPAVAAVSFAGYTAFLAGPPAIGGLAELAGLRAALVLLVAPCLLAAGLATVLRVPAANGAVSTLPGRRVERGKP